MTNPSELLLAIHEVFPARRPKGLALATRGVDIEPIQARREFIDKDDWTLLNDQWLDKNGILYLFLSKEAQRFYLPAFLTADIRTGLQSFDPRWHLIDWLVAPDRLKPVGGWFKDPKSPFEHGLECWTPLAPNQASVVVEYLRWKAALDPELPSSMRTEDALEMYWLAHANEGR